MNGLTVLIMVLLGPPAMFGVAVFIDDWRAERRWRRERDLRAEQQRRVIGPEDRPDWGRR